MSKVELIKNETHTPDNSSWLERNVNLIVMGLCVVCAVTVIAQVVFPMFDEHHPPHFPRYELPPFGGSWSKWYLALGAADAVQPWFIAVLMVSSLLNIAYLIPIPIRGFYFTSGDAAASGGAKSFEEAPLMCVVPLCLTALGGFALFLFASRIYDFLQPVVQG